MSIYKSPGIYTKEVDICFSPHAPKWYVRRIKLGRIFNFPVPEKYWGGSSTGSSGTGTIGTSGCAPINKPVKINTNREFNSIFGKIRVDTNRKYQNNRRYN
jgi:hypothetical protein